LQLAAKGRYTTHPNPRVGCVLVKEARIIAEGWHEYAGGPHAEVNAITAAGEAANGATCYVTLEPCSHTGRTPPCTEALSRAGIKNVIAAMRDPFPEVSGQGLAVLEQRGIPACVGLLEAVSADLNRGYVKRWTEHKPFVRCKMAISLDGRTAMANGESKWITGKDARLDVQRLRAGSSAIMTGVGTVIADDPGLDVREIDCAGRQPLRIVVDRDLNFPVHARMLQLAGRTLIVTTNNDPWKSERLQEAGASIVVIKPAGDGFLDAVLYHLAVEAQVNELLVETGSRLAGSMLNAGMIDELIVYQAPVLMGDSGKGLFHLPGIQSMSQKIILEQMETRMVGADMRMTFKVTSKQTGYDRENNQR
jgi:diaminohydroxyphosphoribosylaminopyrimidine deaminase/5-amino-6-(5-phosphoribosylamino)uracil reductase